MGTSEEYVQLWSKDIPAEYDGVLVLTVAQVCDELGNLPDDIRDKLIWHLRELAPLCSKVRLHRGGFDEGLKSAERAGCYVDCPDDDRPQCPTADDFAKYVGEL